MKLLKKMIATTALTVAAMSATSANAATLLAKYTPAVGAAGAFSFNIDSDPVPTTYGSDYFNAAITNATGQLSGATQLTFYSLSAFGGFGVYFGPQLYTGTTAAPHFVAGSVFNLSGGPAVNGTFTLSNAAGAVPEPATWAMMLAGVGMMGFAMRRRNKNVTTTVAYAA